MAIELKFQTRTNLAEELITEGEVNPIIDFDGVRYSISISKGRGMVEWVPFTLATQTIIGDKIYTVPYAAHSILLESILGASSKSYPRFATSAESTFPNFPVPPDMGSVTP